MRRHAARRRGAIGAPAHCSRRTAVLTVASPAWHRRQQALESSGALGRALGGIISALDFQEDIAEDRSLLAAAKRLGRGEQMSREQYGALRRKVGGTGSGFFGETVALKGRYADRGWVEGQDEPAPARRGVATKAAKGAKGAPAAAVVEEDEGSGLKGAAGIAVAVGVLIAGAAVFALVEQL